MKLYELFVSQKELVMLRDKHYKNFAVALKIAEKIKDFETKVDFYAKEEKRIAEKYGVKDENGNLEIQNGGQIHFANKEDALNFNKEINDLRNTEVDAGEKIKIDIAKDIDKDEVDFSPKDILVLMNFVDFASEEDK